MPFHQVGELRYYTFDIFQDAPITQAAFTRRGGVSPEPFAGLNVGATVGDDLDNVAENRRRIFQAVGRDVASLADSWQVHGAEVLVVEQRGLPAIERNVAPKADALITAKPDITLFMRFADCVPILLYDPGRPAVGIAHAGWQGTVKRTATEAVKAMQARYGSRPVEMLAAIGPSISPPEYEVGPEVVDQLRQSFGEKADELLPQYNGNPHLDLWRANRLALEEAGVEHIEVAGICTARHLEDWFSHRGERGVTGRFGVLIGLNPS